MIATRFPLGSKRFVIAVFRTGAMKREDRPLHKAKRKAPRPFRGAGGIVPALASQILHPDGGAGKPPRFETTVSRAVLEAVVMA
jgi:hypothetical protein